MSPNARKWLLIGGGIVVGVVVLAICVLTLLGPRIGNVFSSTTSSLGSRPGLAPQRSALQPADNFAASGFGGGAAQPAAQEAAAAPTEAPIQATAVGGSTDQQTIQRLIIRNGNITVSVGNTYDARNKILGMVSQMAGDGAFVVSAQESGGGGDVSPYINMEIRVPAAKFSDTMNAIAGLAAKGTTPQRNETAQDVTDQYVDVKARLTTMEAARDRLQQIMASAQNTTDLLQAESLLTQREADIEALKGRMQYLEQSAALSAITIQLSPYILSQPVDTSWQPGETFRNALDSLIGSLRDFADFLITFVIAVLPWLVVAGLIIWGIVRFIRSRVRRGRSQAVVAAPPQDES